MDLKYFCHTNSFKSMLIDTEKYRELYKTSEGQLAILCAVIFTVMILFLNQNISDLEMTDVLKSIFSTLISGMMGLLGFLVTGLAMMASIITKNAVRNIDTQGKSKSLAGILFSFYFEGAVVGFNIITMTFFYMLLSFSEDLSSIVLFFSTLAISYTFNFAVLYAVSLLGSCINFFFVNIYYDKNSKEF